MIFAIDKSNQRMPTLEDGTYKINILNFRIVPCNGLYSFEIWKKVRQSNRMELHNYARQKRSKHFGIIKPEFGAVPNFKIIISRL